MRIQKRENYIIVGHSPSSQTAFYPRILKKVVFDPPVEYSEDHFFLVLECPLLDIRTSHLQRPVKRTEDYFEFQDTLGQSRTSFFHYFRLDSVKIADLWYNEL